MKADECKGSDEAKGDGRKEKRKNQLSEYKQKTRASDAMTSKPSLTPSESPSPHKNFTISLIPASTTAHQP